MPKKRRVNKRKPKKRILILCEGRETEPNYFNGLKRDKAQRNRLAALRIEVYDSNKSTGKELVIQAKHLKTIARQEKNPYDDAWVVIDKDGYMKHPHAFDQARANKINIAFSSISFEFWFLLHYDYTTRSFSKADDLIRYLRSRYMADYDKTDDNYSKLKELTTDAIQHAVRAREYFQNDLDRGKRIYELNPYTDVDVLVDKLLKLD